jgi:hypothetical protein
MSVHTFLRIGGLAAAALAGLPSSTAFAQQGPIRLTLTAPSGKVTYVDLGRPGRSVGDVVAFDGPLEAEDGSRAGHIYGTQTTIRLGRREDVVQAMATLELAGGTIVIGGTSRYDRRDRTGTRVGQSFERAIIGGTGIYAGARGTDTTTRTGRLTYRHAISLLP